MASLHNIVLRGLNAIYLQAPHIQPADEKSFCAFIANWHSILHLHHAAEEEDAFPLIEKMAGEKGIMEVNVEQHEAFQSGLGALEGYAAGCAAGKETYDGRKVVEIIDGFGAVLAEHLADEIPTIEGLRKYGAEKMAGLKGILQAEADRNMVSCFWEE
ncbi:hemerythrin domain-containing protein [Candidatus Bathyarchaeota archaeon]|nr:hemerythrin domain-containing protein [Candidatus Bathyarchaeota archaeon]